MGAFFENIQSKLRLGQGFASTKRKPAARLKIKRFVLDYLSDNLVGSHLFAVQTESIGWTVFDAESARVAGPCPIGETVFIYRQSFLWAGVNAGPAPQAFPPDTAYFGENVLRFRRRAPYAMKRAAFEENYRAQSVSIVAGRPLYSEYPAFYGHF